MPAAPTGGGHCCVHAAHRQGMNTYEANKSSIEKDRKGNGEFGSKSFKANDSLVLPAAPPARMDAFDEDGTEWLPPYFKDVDRPDVLLSQVGGVENSVWTHDGRFTWEVVDHRDKWKRRSLKRGWEDTEEAAREAAKTARTEALAWGDLKLSEGSSTPWGAADHVSMVAPGIYSVGTPSHGGMKVTAARNRGIDQRWRSTGGFYEEDCEQAIPILTYQDEFEKNLVDHAHETARRWYPEKYREIVESDPVRYGVGPE